MITPRVREEHRFVHVDSSLFIQDEKNKYTISLGSSGIRDANNKFLSPQPENFHCIPVQDYNNIVKVELVTFKFSNEAPDTDYVFLKIKNINGKVDSSTPCQDSTAVIYFEGSNPTMFRDHEFMFYPSIAKLSELNVELLDKHNNILDHPFGHSFVLKLTYIEGNFY